MALKLCFWRVLQNKIPERWEGFTNLAEYDETLWHWHVISVISINNTTYKDIRVNFLYTSKSKVLVITQFHRYVVTHQNLHLILSLLNKNHYFGFKSTVIHKPWLKGFQRWLKSSSFNFSTFPTWLILHSTIILRGRAKQSENPSRNTIYRFTWYPKCNRIHQKSYWFLQLCWIAWQWNSILREMKPSYCCGGFFF